MKKYFTLKRVITLIVIAWLGYYWYIYFFKKSATNTFITVKTQVKKWNIEDSVRVIGTSQVIDQQKMRFNQIGKVAKVYVKEGDIVKKWQLLAELDSTDVLNAIKQASVSLSNAKIKLAQTTKWPEQKDVIKAQNDIDTTTNSLNVAKDTYRNLLSDRDNKLSDLQKQIDLKNEELINKTNDLQIAKNDLDTLIKQEWINVSNFTTDNSKTLDTAFSDARKYNIDAENLLIIVDEIFWISDANRSKNDAFEVYLSAKNNAYKNNTESQWMATNLLLAENKAKFNAIDPVKLTKENVTDLFNSISKTYGSLIILSKSASDAVQSSISSSTFAQSQIDSYYSDMVQVWSQSQSSYNGIQTTLVNVAKITPEDIKNSQSQSTIAQKQSSINTQELTIKNLQNDLDSATKTLEYTRNDYETKIKQQEFTIKNLENSLALNRENKNYLVRWATAEEMALAKNNITSQALALENSKKNLDKYRLIAPFDGVVDQIDFKNEDNLVADDTKYIYLENPNLVQITATLDQLDIVKVKIWQDARIVFDSFPKNELPWKVSEINPSPVQTSGVTSYNIKITLDKWEFRIFSGMSASINIIIETKKNILTVPSSFVQKRKEKSFVNLENPADKTGSGISTEVVTGISNLLNTEIMSGLNEWDTVIRLISTSTGSTQWSLVPTPPGGTRDRGSPGWFNWGENRGG